MKLEIPHQQPEAPSLYAVLINSVMIIAQPCFALRTNSIEHTLLSQLPYYTICKVILKVSDVTSKFNP